MVLALDTSGGWQVCKPWPGVDWCGTHLGWYSLFELSSEPECEQSVETNGDLEHVGTAGLSFICQEHCFAFDSNCTPLVASHSHQWSLERSYLSISINWVALATHENVNRINSVNPYFDYTIWKTIYWTKRCVNWGRRNLNSWWGNTFYMSSIAIQDILVHKPSILQTLPELINDGDQWTERVDKMIRARFIDSIPLK